MKIKAEHLAHIKTEIEKVLAIHNANGELVAAYEKGEFARAEQCKDYQKRFCFDLSYAAGLNKFICDELYSYMDDTHLYTALKSVCPVLNLKKVN